MLLTYDAGEIEEQDGETASHGEKPFGKKQRGNGMEKEPMVSRRA